MRSIGKKGMCEIDYILKFCNFGPLNKEFQGISGKKGSIWWMKYNRPPLRMMQELLHLFWGPIWGKSFQIRNKAIEFRDHKINRH